MDYQETIKQVNQEKVENDICDHDSRWLKEEMEKGDPDKVAEWILWVYQGSQE